jgi:hypothetical protein
VELGHLLISKTVLVPFGGSIINKKPQAHAPYFGKFLYFLKTHFAQCVLFSVSFFPKKNIDFFFRIALRAKKGIYCPALHFLFSF